jgi:hypothetical protein
MGSARAPRPEEGRFMRCIGLALVAIGIAAHAPAAEMAGVRLEDKASVAGQELVLNGAGVRSRAIFKVYVASLYLPAKAGDLQSVLSKAPRRIQLNLLRKLSADQLVDALNDGLRDNNSDAELAAIKPQIDELASAMRAFKEVKQGDVVALDYADGTTRIVWNGEANGSIAGEPFNRALMRIWLGEHPVQSDLKRALLGN